MYGSFESHQSMEWLEADREFKIALVCTARSVRARLSGSPEDCYPAEAPEFELDSIHIVCLDGKLRLLEYHAFVAIFGTVEAAELLKAAEDEAIESGEF